MSDFPERLQRLREAKHLSRRTLSELCGLHPDAVRRYERREDAPSLAAAEAIADYFEISLDYLTGRRDTR